MTNTHPEDRPNVTDVRNALAASLTPQQLQTLAVWLGLEAIEYRSEPMFQLGKIMGAIAQDKVRAS